MRALVVIGIACAILACASNQDGGADLVRTFFGHLEAHRFDAAADLVREADGAPLSTSTRETFIRGWRRSYEGYEIHFSRIAVQRFTDFQSQRVPAEEIQRAGAVEGHAYSVKFEGTSTSPCVPVNSDIIPGTSQPIALKRADGTWFLLAGGLVGFVSTCPGG
jgi:hypothetical protein